MSFAINAPSSLRTQALQITRANKPFSNEIVDKKWWEKDFDWWKKKLVIRS
jgi:hypothetical protein